MTPKVRSKTDQSVPFGLLGEVKYALATYGLLGTAARYLLMRDEMSRFVRLGHGGEAAFRRQLLSAFHRIHREIPCAHSPLQFVLMARLIFGCELPGPIVQCGTFKGGSTAKLSLIARHCDRRLFVCDSFSGLPAPTPADEIRQVGWQGQSDFVFAAGEYCGGLDEVRSNVARLGAIEVCEFVAGLFADTLPTLDVEPAIVFIDVDYVTSARDCLKNLWPRLKPGGIWFTHEAGLVSYIEGMLDPKWWEAALGSAPPVLWGGGTGLSPVAPAIAYFCKPR
jgi:hypothetical protein